MYDDYLPKIASELASIDNLDSAEYTRPDIFSASDSEILEEVKSAEEAGLMTKKMAIMTYL